MERPEIKEDEQHVTKKMFSFVGRLMAAMVMEVSCGLHIR